MEKNSLLNVKGIVGAVGIGLFFVYVGTGFENMYLLVAAFMLLVISLQMKSKR